MTNEERREAERLAKISFQKEYAKFEKEHRRPFDYDESFLHGYAAACEANEKNKEFSRRVALPLLEKLLAAERARSEKLYEVLKFYRDLDWKSNTEAWQYNARTACADFEASRD